ncbi:MAG: ATP-binding cassette domain-containing protein [Firmicutes bacterium]|nr:ATP-binding cassette domain-containing protein [Bacillota bacterium]
MLSGLFDGLTLKVDAGERLAILGANGVGKSTLLRLIAGLLDPEDGQVQLDGQDIADCRWDDLRQAFAMVSPDLPLLRGTLRLNLTYGAKDWTQEKLERVIENLSLDALAARLPAGIESRISEMGSGLSTGERARIALARALLSQPRVLLLDEAEANLDAASRRALDRAIAGFSGTVIFITHDMARAAGADRALRLEAGQLNELSAEELEAENTAPPTLQVVR